MKPASTPMRHFLTLVQTVLACAPAQIARLTRGLLACMLLTLLGAAQAASVTGTIISNTTWTPSQSPYVLQGDVVLDNNATLTIQPGVQVRMAAGASFTLKKGALQAVGTASSPIVITSDAAGPKPGDWRQWRLTGGTNSAQTILDYVQMSYGSGLVVESSAPVLNNLTLQNHSGPAISIDLAASPTGRNLSASGNALNAIAVPSGTIRSQVVWGLVGIPYLVQQGIVQIGQSPLSLEPTRLKLSPGVVAILRLAVSAPAPTGGLGIDLTSSVPSVATVSSRATVAAGQYGADVEVQAKAVGATSITASHATLGSAAAVIEVVNLPALELLPTSPTIGVQRPTVMTLRAPQAAPAGGLTVTFGNSDNTVLRAPASVLIPAGQHSASFEVTGLTDGTSRLSAEAEGFATGLSTVTVRGKALVLPSSIVVAPGAQTQSTVQLTEPAPAGGLTVNLATAATGTATVPASVNVPAGASQASFNVSGVALGTTQLTASASGYQGTQTTVRVDAISLDLEPVGNLVLNVDQSLTRRVQLSKAAPAGGVKVQVAIENTATATVTPAEVMVPEGQVFGLVPLTIKGLAVGQTKLNLTASGLLSKTVTVDVREKIGLRLYQVSNQSKVIAGKGLNSYAWELRVQRLVNGVVTSGADAVTVNLRCVAETICKVPSTVTIPAGDSQAAIPITGVDVGATQIEATANGATAATPMPVEVIAPTIRFVSLDGNRTTVSPRDDFYLSLDVPGATYGVGDNGWITTTQALTVNLSLTEQTPAGVVQGIYSAATGGSLINQIVIPAGRGYTGTTYVAQPSLAGTYRVSAGITGVASGLSAVQTVAAANAGLKLYQASNQSKVIAGKGLNSYAWELRVQRLVNGVVTSGADAVTVNLRCVAETICKVPSTVTIPAGDSQAAIPITGVDVGATQIEATADGATAATPMPVEVIAPTIRFVSLDGNRTTVSPRDDFYLSLDVPGATYGVGDNGWITTTQALTVNLSLTEQTPAGVVQGIYSAATGGSLINQIVIPAGRGYTGTTYVAQPSLAGTYRVSAGITGVASGLSAVQTVAAANAGLKLYQASNQSKVIAGKGLNSYAWELRVQRLVNGVVTSGADAVTVNLRCVAETICKVPSTVTIPAGDSQAAIPITGVDVGATQIEATADGATAATPMPVEVIAPTIRFVSLDGNRTTVSPRDDFYLSLDVPGATYGVGDNGWITTTQALTVNLSLTEQTPAGVVQGIYSAATGGSLINQIVIPAGRGYTGTTYVAQPSLAGTYRVSAGITGVASGLSAVQTVAAANQSLKLWQVNGRPKVIAGKGFHSYSWELRVQRVVNGTVSVGADPVTISLRCVAETICKVPATVTIPAGDSQAAVPITGIDVGSTQIEATASGFDSGAISMETVSPQLTFASAPPATMTAGQQYTSLYFYADVPGVNYGAGYIVAAQPITIALTSSVPSAATVTSSVTWPAGGYSSNYGTITAVAPGTTTITASARGFNPVTSAAITVNP